MDWMRDLPDSAKDRPLQDLCIPGSHNAATASLRSDLPIAIDQPQAVHSLAHGPFASLTKVRILSTQQCCEYVQLFNALLCLKDPNLLCRKKIISTTNVPVEEKSLKNVRLQIFQQVVHSWSRCQSLPIGDQLKLGIRYLDLRLAKIPSTSEIAIVHGLYGPSLESVLLEILGFLTDHQSEVVILDFNHQYGFDPSDHAKVVGTLSDLLGDIAADPLRPGDAMRQGDASALATLRQLQNAGKRVVLFYHGQVENYPKIWPKDGIMSPWTQKHIEPKTVFEHQTSCLTAKENGMFCVSQLIPSFEIDARNVVHALTTSVEKQSAKFWEFFKDWWPSAKEMGFNVISMNFVNEEFVNLVVEANK